MWLGGNLFFGQLSLSEGDCKNAKSNCKNIFSKIFTVTFVTIDHTIMINANQLLRELNKASSTLFTHKDVTNLLGGIKGKFEKKDNRIIIEASLGKEYAVGEVKYYIDKLETGGKVTDGEGKPLAKVEIEIEGKKISTDENGIIKETEKKEEMEGEDVAALKESILKKDEEIVSLKAKISELEASKTQMSAQIATSASLLTKMADEVKKGIKPGGSGEKKYEEMSNYEKAKFNRERK